VSHWLEDAVTVGLTYMDVPEALESMVSHFSAKGEWRKGVISPSLVAVQCPLQRVKIFLGHKPDPNAPVHMNVRAAKQDFSSTVMMTRGFAGEALILAALKRTLPVWVVASAPDYHVEWTDPESGFEYAGHPDVLGTNDGKLFQMIQIKTPSVFKLDRIEKYGEQDALKTYMPQMATEMFIARRAGIEVIRNTLLLFSWEGSPKNNRPRVKAIDLEWDESLASIPEQAAWEINDAAAKALLHNTWPQAYPATSWDIWPCGYCRYARLGDFEVPACDDHERWRSNESKQSVGGSGRHNDLAGGSGSAEQES
jgi:hypothetical protein